MIRFQFFENLIPINFKILAPMAPTCSRSDKVGGEETPYTHTLDHHVSSIAIIMVSFLVYFISFNKNNKQG